MIYRMGKIEQAATEYIKIAVCNSGEATAEGCFSSFMGIEKLFANRLDALLLKRGIDLLLYQEISGIYLKAGRSPYDLEPYMGSLDFARYCIRKLNT